MMYAMAVAAATRRPLLALAALGLGLVALAAPALAAEVAERVQGFVLHPFPPTPWNGS
jgi:hypothetical protein